MKVADCGKCDLPITTHHLWPEFAWVSRRKVHLNHKPGAHVIYYHALCDPYERWKSKLRFRGIDPDRWHPADAANWFAAREDGQMATVAERRAKLEEKLSKLNPEQAVEKAVARQAKLRGEIAKLEEHKDIEGKTGKVNLGKGVFINVIVVGYERKVYGKELYRVAVADGDGTMTTTREKLVLDGEGVDPSAGQQEATPRRRGKKE